MIGKIIPNVFIIIGIILFIQIFNRRSKRAIRLILFGISLFIFYLILGIPFISPSPIKSYLCMGFEGQTENIITHEVRSFGSCYIPIGWKSIPPKVLPYNPQ